jgi:hypothetical protein
VGENEFMSELRGVVYRLKRMGPRTEPWGCQKLGDKMRTRDQMQ